MELNNSYSGKKVLITGGGGFIGSNLAIRLIELGAEISIMDARLKPYGYNPFNLSSIKDKIKIDFSDIRDKTAVERNIANKEIIFNLAAQVGEKLSEQNPELDRDINVNGHRNFLETCVAINPAAKVLFSGSRLQYGKTEEVSLVSEDHPMNPLSHYAKNKMIGEQMYQDFFNKEGLKTVSFRIANPFGPRAIISNPGYCIVNWFVGRALNGQNLPIYGDGTQQRDYIFIDDLVEAMTIAAIKEESSGKIYNVGSGRGCLFKDMAQKVSTLAETTSKLEFLEWPAEAKNRETGNFVADISKIKRELEWAPNYSLEAGLKKTMEFYKENISYY